MGQYARPSADVTAGSWTSATGSASNLFAAIDEESPDDADYVQCAAATNDAYEVRLSAVLAPLINRGHVLRYRMSKGTLGGNQRGVTVELRQGTTVIASNSHPDLTTLWIPGAILLTPEQAATITDYTDLRVRFIATGSTSGPAGSRRRVQVSWCQVRVPEATFGAVEDTSTPGVWRETLNGVTGSGASRLDALVDLFTQLQAANENDTLTARRWVYVYYARKLRDYNALRAAIIAGTYQLPFHQTQADALAICDQKLARFDTVTADADNADVT